MKDLSLFPNFRPSSGYAPGIGAQDMAGGPVIITPSDRIFNHLLLVQEELRKANNKIIIYRIVTAVAAVAIVLLLFMVLR